MSGSVGASQGERMQWVDAARGVCIVLVSLFHAGLVFAGPYGVTNGIWPEVSDVLAPLRMPLFFFVSGLLARGALTRPLARTRRRTVGLFYLYALWTLLHLYVAALWRGWALPDPGLAALAALLPAGSWYLYALVVFFLVAVAADRLLRGSAVWVLLPALVLSVCAPMVDTVSAGLLPWPYGPVFFGSMAANLVWFLAGVFGSAALAAVRARATWWRLAASVAVFAALTSVAFGMGVQRDAKPLLSLVALFAALQLFALVPLDNPAGRLVAAIGRRTLPIYVMQWIPMVAIMFITDAETGIFGWGISDAVANLVIPATAVLMVAFGWWAGWGIDRVSLLRPLLHAPAWLIGRPEMSQPGRREGRVDSSHEDADASPDRPAGLEHHPRADAHRAAE
jgi:uncharacterized membrane protein YcfT